MNLVNKKKICRNGINYLIDVNKVFYSNVSGDDHYIYEVSIYSSNVKRNKGLKKLFFKEYEYKCLHEYSTYWLHYFDYNGDIDKVINEAFKIHQ